MEHFFAPLEVKFAEDAPAGEFSGYGAVFGNLDAHGDVIRPGAFRESLAEIKAAGRRVPMHVLHRGKFGGDGIPVGVWKHIEEDAHGLRVEGKISGVNTDAGRLLYERVKDGALGGLSIGYRIHPDGAIYGKAKGEPKRTLLKLGLDEISLVDNPSNALSRVEEVKAFPYAVDPSRAAQSIAAALALHAECLAGGDSPNSDERDLFLQHLQDAHEALTGSRMPAGLKMAPRTIREAETMLRASLGLSHSQARAFAEHGFKSLLSSTPRDEGGADPAISQEVKAAIEDLKGLAGFRLPNLRG